uniref:Uncharacterized protein n=1 Tax=Pipistrellus kuhlii TaxID=59472 RepID=A0A7J7XAP9_PIPKU|nr:hypothetical protein mPipKuh1_010573 [Pipistrellus kuhlii]
MKSDPHLAPIAPGPGPSLCELCLQLPGPILRTPAPCLLPGGWEGAGLILGEKEVLHKSTFFHGGPVPIHRGEGLEAKEKWSGRGRGREGKVVWPPRCPQRSLEKEEAGLDTSPGLSPANQWLGQAEKREGAGYGTEEKHEAPAHRAGVPGATWACLVGGGQGVGAALCGCDCWLSDFAQKTHPCSWSSETPPLLLNKARVL